MVGALPFLPDHAEIEELIEAAKAATRGPRRRASGRRGRVAAGGDDRGIFFYSLVSFSQARLMAACKNPLFS